jgi:hypothetical protein
MDRAAPRYTVVFINVPLRVTAHIRRVITTGYTGPPARRRARFIMMVLRIPCGRAFRLLALQRLAWNIGSADSISATATRPAHAAGRIEFVAGRVRA